MSEVRSYSEAFVTKVFERIQFNFSFPLRISHQRMCRDFQQFCKKYNSRPQATSLAIDWRIKWEKICSDTKFIRRGKSFYFLYNQGKFFQHFMSRFCTTLLGVWHDKIGYCVDFMTWQLVKTFKCEQL